MIKDKNLLVFSAHAADYVWRSGGTIAKYIENGANVTVVVMTFGVRGESNGLWKKANQTYDSVKEVRKKETANAAEILGVKNIEYWDLVDYPIEINQELEDRVVETIRRIQPDIILTHDKKDILNPDHNNIHDLVWRASILSNSGGVITEGYPVTKQMRLFGFEPHQTEISGYVPDQFIDITDAYDKKVAAMNCFEGQHHLIEYYKQRAFMRGNHARRLSGNGAYKYAESFANFYPVVSEELI
ncbi:PIG-L deacetylase family protein [uncultured Trichococcus sp.]|uniref:PIG-L deacetylase family protein n=1 Tax=uncultured Trichococcus sp. TaxID=189665 RepID=UPI002A18A29E|nr:PIG-L deacetylase family protein [uncultured Trichococcus sp.]